SCRIKLNIGIDSLWFCADHDDMHQDEDEINDDDEIVTVGDEIDDCEDKFCNDDVVIDDGDEVVGGTYELVDEEEIDTII
ncbi:unnamed protein product, partial [Rotaria socialis]